MGTVVSFDVRDTEPADAAIAAATAWLHAVDARFSPYRADSEIARLDRGELLPSEASPDVQAVLSRCARLRTETAGFFDVRAAGRLDPSALVKGWAVAWAAEMLGAAGLRNFCVSAGGDLVTSGDALPEAGWRVAIQHPREREAVAAVVRARDLAVATSGLYERGAHLRDPGTGRAPDGVLSVTVTGPDLGLADAYSTAAFAMGADGPAWTLALQGYEAMTILADDTVVCTPGFPVSSTLWAGDWVETRAAGARPGATRRRAPRRAGGAAPAGAGAAVVGRRARRRSPGSASGSRSRWRSAPRAPGRWPPPAASPPRSAGWPGWSPPTRWSSSSLLVARFPPLERAIGQDRLVAWHRSLGPWPLYLLLAHAVLITVGYARAAHDGLLHQFGQLLWTYPGDPRERRGRDRAASRPASAPTGSHAASMAYETWWSVHLYTYLALFLSFSHQVDTGASFVGPPGRARSGGRPCGSARSRSSWAAGSGCRSGARCATGCAWSPSRRRARAPSRSCSRGRRLDRLPVAGGQFLQWRFLRPRHVVAGAPVLALGRPGPRPPADHGQGPRRPQRARSPRLRPGPGSRSRVPTAPSPPTAAMPTGSCSSAPASARTPIRALLQDLPGGRRRRRAAARLARARTWCCGRRSPPTSRGAAAALIELVGPRERVPLDAAALRRLVPDLADARPLRLRPRRLHRSCSPPPVPRASPDPRPPRDFAL